jgi:hypothetical protein
MRLPLPSGHCLYFVAQVKRHDIRSSSKKVTNDVDVNGPTPDAMLPKLAAVAMAMPCG